VSALRGRRIIITRAPHQAGAFEARLRECGAIPLLYPCIEILPSDDTDALDAALHEDSYDWLVLTSANTVYVLANRLKALGRSNNPFRNVQVAAVGSVTAAAAEEYLGLHVTTVPDQFIAESVPEAMGFIAGKRILLPQSALADSALADLLATAGADVTRVDAYRTGIGSGGVHLPALLMRGEVDAITFTSASTVNNFVVRFRDENGQLSSLAGVCIACIGPKTAATAREQGFTIHLQPATHTLDALVSSLDLYFAGVQPHVHG